jgi:hypothetical protein
VTNATKEIDLKQNIFLRMRSFLRMTLISTDSGKSTHAVPYQTLFAGSLLLTNCATAALVIWKLHTAASA